VNGRKVSLDVKKLPVVCVRFCVAGGQPVYKLISLAASTLLNKR
jgi:hypothetical protein